MVDKSLSNLKPEEVISPKFLKDYERGINFFL